MFLKYMLSLIFNFDLGIKQKKYVRFAVPQKRDLDWISSCHYWLISSSRWAIIDYFDSLLPVLAVFHTFGEQLGKIYKIFQ